MVKNITVLAIDDTAENLGVVENILEEEGYDVLVAINGKMGLTIAQSNIPDIILLDIMMPGWNGFETARQIKKHIELQHIPIIFLSALDDTESKVHAFDSGGVDYVSKPFQRPELLSRVKNHVELHQLRSHLQTEVAKKTAEIQKSYEDAICLLSMASEYRDYETGAHNSRLGIYAAMIAKEFKWSDSEIKMIRHAAPLHDVGKIGIPDNILHKPDVLTINERKKMEEHADIGRRILSSRGMSPLLKMATNIAGGHHEKYNGGGYPLKLAGEEIPLEARITSICDVYDALRSVRPYKKSFSHNDVLGLILEGDKRTSPCHFDPIALSHFHKLHEQFNEIFLTMNDNLRHV